MNRRREAFWRGFGSVLNLFPAQPARKRVTIMPPQKFELKFKTDAEAWAADAKALEGDWKRVMEGFK